MIWVRKMTLMRKKMRSSILYTNQNLDGAMDLGFYIFRSQMVTLSFALDFESSCDINLGFSQQPSTSSTVRTSHHINISAVANYHFAHQIPPPTKLFSQQPLPTPQAQWRLATKVHAQAITAAHIQTVATTIQETHATHDHAATAVTHATVLLTPPAAAPAVATLPTDTQTATPDQPVRAHPTAPHTPATTVLHANDLPLVDLVVRPTAAITASRMARLKRLLRR
jgi:hypothetical protein